MAIREYECIFATDEPFRGWRLAYDEDEGFQVRMYEARLPMSADSIFADLNTPSGIQMMAYHDADRQSVGRVLSMSFSKGILRGVASFNEDDLKSAVEGGFAAFENGIMTGLSAGFHFLDNPPVKFEKRDGDEKKPDKMTYGKLELREVSLTSIPRLKQSGIVRRLGGDDEPPETAEEPEKEPNE